MIILKIILIIKPLSFELLVVLSTRTRAPRAGRVCVPFDPQQVDAFDAGGVPSIAQLVQEIDDRHAGDDKRPVNGARGWAVV